MQRRLLAWARVAPRHVVAPKDPRGGM
jgi:hypothetical protein